MTVKRLDVNQPESFSFSKEDIALINNTIQNYPESRKQSAVVPSLYIAQKRAGGWLPEQAILKVAEMLDMPKMRVLEIASFYSMFNLKPTGDHFIQVCGTTPCWLRGSDKIKKACQDLVGNEGEVSKDNISWLEVECLGACVNAPAVQINEDYYEDLNYENMSLLINNIKKKKDIKVGSQTGRVSSEPIKMEESDA
ncbi:MAG: complex I 24 kDa subunit family protein [Alphaproteobacteria bacterium]|jgi:NADH-quinone oxidoreductase subunit E|nr:MAG: NADH-quinone oxidoreductase subunit E [alpha proteobacterium MED-G09]|tara:strand:+ start:8208 stop:8795 length:588 start_codon:yes stop_codon:yes gene_type:complete